LIATTKALDLIAQTLTPYIGRTMAEASARMHCDRLGIGRNGQLADDELESLVKRIGGALTVFVGAAATEAVTTRLREGLGLLAAASASPRSAS
jgi:hypothetical protein